MELLTISLFAVLFLLVVWISSYYRNPAGFPPGPKGIFLLGFIPFIKPRSFLKFAALKKVYGDVVSIRIGVRRVVLLLSNKSIEEALVKKADNFSGRLTDKFVKDNTHSSGIINVDGPVWQEHRRFSLHVLRDFGFGRNLSEQIIQEEAQRLLECLEAFEGRPCNPFFDVLRAVSSVICSITFAEHPAYDDAKYDKVVASFRENIKVPLHLIPPVGFPFIAYFRSFFELLIPKYKQLKENLESTHDYIREKIKQHRATIDWNGEPRDFTDAYLLEQAKQQASGQQHTYTDWQLVRVIMELFIAGTDTTANSLHWFLFMLALNPDIQTRVHREIDEIIGQNRQPNMKDKTTMPYLAATLDEVQRYASIVPNSLIHRNLKEDTVCGYRIPANTTIVPCLYACHHDPDVWSEPSQFRPERFLSVDGKEYKSRNELIPFSMGRRTCLGESLAKMELFLFSAFMLQRFSVSMPKGKPVDLENVLMGTDGIIRSAEGFELVLKKRE